MSLTGSSDNVNFEDITASIDLTADLKDDVVCFSSVCTGRYVYFWAQNDNASLMLSTNLIKYSIVINRIHAIIFI